MIVFRPRRFEALVLRHLTFGPVAGGCNTSGGTAVLVDELQKPWTVDRTAGATPAQGGGIQPAEGRSRQDAAVIRRGPGGVSAEQVVEIVNRAGSRASLAERESHIEPTVLE